MSDELVNHWNGVFSERVSKEDIINVKSWMDLGDYNYEVDFDDEDSIPPSGVIYCNIEHIHKFFAKCEKTDNKYIVISGFSDFGVAKQSENPVSHDYIKFMPFLYQTIMQLGYEPLHIPTRCNLENCNIEDEHSVRCYSFTHSTFPKIPNNVVRWYTANSRIEHDKIVHIPLGVGKDAAEEISKTPFVPFDKKTNLIYLNFQDHTQDRFELKRYFGQSGANWLSIIYDSSRNFEEYLDDTSKHFFTLSPEGNGWDCYRNLESLYVGCIPVVSKAPPISYMRDLPVLVLDDIFDFSEPKLLEFLAEHKKYNFDKIKLSFWKEHINKSRKLLVEE